MDDRQIAVVADADTAVGAAAALALARAGHDVAVAGRTAARLEELAVEVLERGTRSLGVQVDRAEPDVVAALADEVERRLGSIHSWIHVHDFAPGSVDAVISRASGLEAVARVMEPHGTGVIIVVNSTAAFRPEAGHPDEAAQAFALRGCSRALHTDLVRRDSGVRMVDVYLPAWMLRAGATLDGATTQGAHAAAVEAAGRSIARAVRRGRRRRVYGASSWFAVQCARLAPDLSDHLAAQGSLDRVATHRTPREEVRALGRATAARAREILRLAATS